MIRDPLRALRVLLALWLLSSASAADMATSLTRSSSHKSRVEH